MDIKKLSLGVSALVLFISSAVSASPININQASASEMAAALSGIGMKKAQAIVSYRNMNGTFSQASDIVNVKGIGSSTFNNNKGDILLKQ